LSLLLLYIVLDALRCSVVICYFLLFSVGIFDFVSGLHLSLLKVLWFFFLELFYVICFRAFSLDTSIRFSWLSFGGRIGEVVKSRFPGGFVVSCTAPKKLVEISRLCVAGSSFCLPLFIIR